MFWSRRSGINGCPTDSDTDLASVGLIVSPRLTATGSQVAFLLATLACQGNPSGWTSSWKAQRKRICRCQTLHTPWCWSWWQCLTAHWFAESTCTSYSSWWMQGDLRVDSHRPPAVSVHSGCFTSWLPALTWTYTFHFGPSLFFFVPDGSRDSCCFQYSCSH